jgi:hypothetical protein
LHVLVDPVPVAATVLLSSKNTGLVVPSSTETTDVHVKLLTLVDLTVMVIVTVIVPVNVVAAGSSVSSSTAAGTGRNAPVWGSRYPRIPGLAGAFAAWPQTAGAAKRQYVQIINSRIVVLISSPP